MANRGGNATVTAVGDSATSVTLLAANQARQGFVIYNNSSAILYLKFGSAAVIANSFTVQLDAEEQYESGDFVYTGLVSGIWASAAGGNALVTEVT